ncbi:MAG: hypothetical protein G01um10148_732 [Parcubacteria group bacterium Gr01-1014_8]|nr:MAG: hypothetical protein G01um10148_732 [Parcubacteria group bacterium Gr01-1014_8]
MKISLKETEAFDRGEFKGNLYTQKKDNKGFNALLVDCLTGHYKTRLKGAARVYFVLEGSGMFTINGGSTEVEQYDLIILESGDEYSYKGSMKLFEFNVPATDASNEEKLD